MHKLTLTCDCGQQMLVPESAMGKIGLCPNCAREIPISPENTRPESSTAVVEHRRGGGLLAHRHAVRRKAADEEQEHAWRKFATAVDLYSAERYAEALTVLDGLLREFPDNPDVQSARTECIRALQISQEEVRLYDGRPVDAGFLNSDLVRSVILEKMLHGSDDAIQLQATDMAARLLGLYANSPEARPQTAMDAVLVANRDAHTPDPAAPPQTQSAADPSEVPPVRPDDADSHAAPGGNGRALAAQRPDPLSAAAQPNPSRKRRGKRKRV